MNKITFFAVGVLALAVFLVGCVEKNGIVLDSDKYCQDSSVDGVYNCGDVLQVVSKVPGAGSTYYKADSSSFRCPIVAPDSMSQECKDMLDVKCESVC